MPGTICWPKRLMRDMPPWRNHQNLNYCKYGLWLLHDCNICCPRWYWAHVAVVCMHQTSMKLWFNAFSAHLWVIYAWVSCCGQTLSTVCFLLSTFAYRQHLKNWWTFYEETSKEWLVLTTYIESEIVFILGQCDWGEFHGCLV